MIRHRTLFSTIVAVVLLAGACSGGPDSTTDPPPPAVTEDPCLLVTPDERVEVLGQDYEADEDATSADGCLLRGVDGQSVLVVHRGRAEEPAVFESMVAVPDAETIDDLGDDARFWADEEPVRAHLLVRSGGSTLRFELSGPFPFEERPDDPEAEAEAEAEAGEPDETEADDGADQAEANEDDVEEVTVDDIIADMRARLVSLARASIERLPELPFGEEPGEENDEGERRTVVPGADVCESIDAEVLDKVVGAEPGTGTLTPLAETGCTYSGGDGVTLMIEAMPGEATTESLEGFGREMVEDGETYTWTPEPVEDLGDGAVWLADPRDDTTGELYVLFGSSLLRITSSVTAGGDEVRAYAETAAVFVAGAIDWPTFDDPGSVDGQADVENGDVENGDGGANDGSDAGDDDGS